MKKYTDLSFAETAQAMEDGKCVQRLVEVSALRSRHWVTSTNKSVSIDTRYRLVEEEEPQYRPIKHIVRQFDGSVKEWAAEVGEPVLVRIRTEEYKDYGYTFRAIVDNKYICKDRFGGLVGWDEIAPVKKEVTDLTLTEAAQAIAADAAKKYPLVNGAGNYTPAGATHWTIGAGGFKLFYNLNGKISAWNSISRVWEPAFKTPIILYSCCGLSMGPAEDNDNQH